MPQFRKQQVAWSSASSLRLLGQTGFKDLTLFRVVGWASSLHKPSKSCLLGDSHSFATSLGLGNPLPQDTAVFEPEVALAQAVTIPEEREEGCDTAGTKDVLSRKLDA